MTSVEAAAPRATPADGSGKVSPRLESGGGFDEADAGFSQQLASVAADGDGSANACASRPSDRAEGAVVRWWRQQAHIEASQAVPGPAQGDEQAAQAASALLADNELDAPVVSAPAADASSGDGSEALVGNDSAASATNPAARIAAVLASAASIMPAVATVQPASAQTPPRTPADPQPPTLPEPLHVITKDGSAATPRMVDVKVVGAETHLVPALRVLPAAPAASSAASAERTGAAGSRTSDETVDSPKPARVNPAPLRGQSAEQSLVQGASDQADADASAPGSNSDDSFAQVAQLSARGPIYANQAGASPAQQIADRIAAELPSAGADGARAAPAMTSRLAPPPESVKVLTIQLHPADLGTVTVRMTLRADGMDVQVETGRRATARLIDADRDALAGLLRSAGYHVEALTVRAVEQPSLVSSPGASQGGPNSGGQLQPGGGQADARASGGQPQPESRDYAQVPDRSSNDSDQAPGERRGTGVYV